MSNLPKHILEALKQNKTSLGEHPSDPPEEEEKFIVNIVTKTFNELYEKVGIKDYDIMKKELEQIISECNECNIVMKFTIYFLYIITNGRSKEICARNLQCSRV